MKFIQENNKIANNNLVKYLFLVITGSSLAFAFAPFNWFLVGAISVSILFIISNNSTKYSKVFLNAIIYGFGFFLAGNYWIAISLLVDAKQHSWMIPFAITLLPLYFAFYIGLACFCYKVTINKLKISNISARILFFSFFWLLFEILRANIFSGFPWNLIGYSWLFNIEIAQFASFFGVYGLSFLAIITLLIPCHFIEIRDNKISYIDPKKLAICDKLFIIALLIFLLILSLYGQYKIKNNKLIDKNYKIRIVQANIRQDLKWDPIKIHDNIISHINLSRNNNHDIDMVIWSEASIPYYVYNDKRLINFLNNAISEKSVLISGGLRKNNEQIYNSFFAINNSAIMDYYDKQHLVPFGEYVPLKKYIPFISKITNGSQDFSRGLENKIIKIKYISITPLICYEAIFSRYSRFTNIKNTDLIINVTNDGWFGNSNGPYQHLAMAQMRAIEFSRPLIRVANTGISAYIDPNGIIKNKLPLYNKGYIDVNLMTSNKNTFFNKIINLFY